MLTGDLSAIVEWTVQWRVVDPAKFLFQIDNDPIAVHGSVSHVNATIQPSPRVACIGWSAIIRSTMLTEKRRGRPCRPKGPTALDKYDCGIQSAGLQMQRVTPPGRVKPSFDAVNTSRRTKRNWSTSLRANATS